MDSQKIYDQIVSEVKKGIDKKISFKSTYMGTPHKYYGLKSSVLGDAIIKNWDEIKDLKYEKWIELLDLFYKIDVFEYKIIAGSILRRSNMQRQNLDLAKIDDWLNYLFGWAEIDVSCQATFDSNEVLGRWNEWELFLRKLNADENISKRRASLVLPIKSLRSCRDLNLMNLAFDNVKDVMLEKDILITKAISWILREMVKKYKGEVSEFVEKYKTQLPAIAVRETRRKIETGRK